MVTFLISVVLAIIALVFHFAHIPNPLTQSGFVILLVSYLVLLFGTLLSGI
jgi:hypothetical protein